MLSLFVNMTMFLFSCLVFSAVLRLSQEDTVSIEQAISDESQLKTLSFSYVGFLTGDFCSSTFFPPGKVSDFFGFQYMRDVMPNHFGHNTEFAGRAADSVLSNLTTTQIQTLTDLAQSQTDLVTEYGKTRYVLIMAFQRLLDEDLPTGTNGLDIDEVVNYTGYLYGIDAEITYTRANVLGALIAGLSTFQKTHLVALNQEFEDLFNSAGDGGTIADSEWPESTHTLTFNGSNNIATLVRTYSAQMLSWLVGNVTADTYFCPERHGTYFGSFFLKDIPPIVATNPETIDTELTANMGTELLAILDDEQRAKIASLVDIQRDSLNDIVTTRAMVSAELRKSISGLEPNYTYVKELLVIYGQLEGYMMYYYASRFASVGSSLNTTQETSIMDLRLTYYKRFSEYNADSSVYDCVGAWMYAEKNTSFDITEIPDTDFLFTQVATTTTAATTTTTIDASCSSFNMEDNMTIKGGSATPAAGATPTTVSSAEECCVTCNAYSDTCNKFFYDAAGGECKFFESGTAEYKPDNVVGTRI